MIKLELEVEVEVSLTAHQLAEEFWKEDSDYQAKFFSSLSVIAVSDLMGKAAFDFQLAAILESEELSRSGRSLLDTIREYVAAEEDKKWTT